MNTRIWTGRAVIGVIALGFSAALAHAQSTNATSPCKGLEQKACAAKAECSWVGATKRKDGRQVKAYCRLKSNRSASTKK